MIARVVGRASHALPRVLPGLVLVLVTVTTGCGSDPARTLPASHRPPSPSPAAASPSPAAASPSAAAASPSPAAASPSAAASATGGPPPAPPHYVFPIGAPAEYGRTHDQYPATDIFAACGAPVRAATDGTVMELSRVDRFDPKHSAGSARGGLFVALHGDDGVRYYSAHLSVLEPAIQVGVRVRAGDVIGRVGHTGNANQICHTHFAISPPCGVGDWWTRRGVIWPWPYLDAWRAGQDLSPAVEVVAWQSAHGCPMTMPPGVH